MAFEVREPWEKHEMKQLMQLMRGEIWKRGDINPDNTRILLNEHDEVVGGVHFEIDSHGAGVIKFMKVARPHEKQGGGQKLLDVTLQHLFEKKHVDRVRFLLHNPHDTFLAKRGFKPAPTGMAITKAKWRKLKEPV